MSDKKFAPRNAAVVESISAGRREFLANAASIAGMLALSGCGGGGGGSSGGGTGGATASSSAPSAASSSASSAASSSASSAASSSSASAPSAGALKRYSFKTTAGGELGGAMPAYLGAFKVPEDAAVLLGLNYTAGAIAIRGTKMFVAGKIENGSVAEINMPSLVNSTRLADLNRGTFAQTAVNIIGKNSTIYKGNGHYIAGLAVIDDALFVSSYANYDQSTDGSYNRDNLQIVRSADSLAGSRCDGYYHNRSYVRGAAAYEAGSFTGWISEIPAQYQAALGGTHLTGWSSSTDRAAIHAASSGPSAHAFTPGALAATASDFSLNTLLNYYPKERAIGGVYTATKDDLYNESRTNTIWTHASECSYGMIIPGTRTYAVFGKSAGHVSGLDYGDAPWGGYKGHYPLDPNDQYNHYWLFDVDDLIKVTQGSAQPWELMPYEWGVFPTPFHSGYLSPIKGGCWDSSTQTLYLCIKGADGGSSGWSSLPVIVAYRFPGIA